MFSRSTDKYTTIGRYLGAAPGQAVQVTPQPGVIMSAPPVQPQPVVTVQDDQNLDLLDGLVAETLAARASATQQPPAATSPMIGMSSARAKELASQSSEQVMQTESAPAPESSETSAEATDTAETSAESSEIRELTQELQEVGKETKEQREQALIKEKQQAINDLAAASTAPVAITDQPVVVLPITAKSKEEAQFKTTQYSVKWLWEWCKKIAKVFSGAVVYKEEVEEA